MPHHVGGVLHELLYRAGVPAGEGRVLFLGWSYKPEVGDPRETPAEPLHETLVNKGISVGVYDPHLDGQGYPEGVTVEADISSAKGYDLAVLITAHQACVELDWGALRANMNHPMLYDGRRVLDLPSLEALGWSCFAVGRPL